MIIYKPEFFEYKKLNKFYTGSTQDLERRLEEHIHGKTAFMKKGVPWIIVYREEFTSRALAMPKEKQIKKRGANRFLQDHGPAVGWCIKS